MKNCERLICKIVAIGSYLGEIRIMSIVVRYQKATCYQSAENN